MAGGARKTAHFCPCRVCLTNPRARTLSASAISRHLVKNGHATVEQWEEFLARQPDHAGKLEVLEQQQPSLGADEPRIEDRQEDGASGGDTPPSKRLRELAVGVSHVEQEDGPEEAEAPSGGLALSGVRQPAPEAKEAQSSRNAQSSGQATSDAARSQEGDREGHGGAAYAALSDAFEPMGEAWSEEGIGNQAGESGGQDAEAGDNIEDDDGDFWHGDHDDWDGADESAEPFDFTGIAARLSHVQEELESGEELFDGSPVGKLLATASLLNLGYEANMSRSSIDELFSLVSHILPQQNSLPQSHKEAAALLSDLRKAHRVVHACINDCCLYVGELADATACETCGEPRYKGDGVGKKPQSVCYHWSIAEAAATLFSSPDAVNRVTAHARLRSRDGIIRSVHDTPQWHTIETSIPNFHDPRMLRLLLVADGVKTFKLGTKVFWPVYLINLNLDPNQWFRPENIILSNLIPRHPSNIQPYLRVIVDELRRFGPESEGFPVLDASRPEEEQQFQLRLLLANTLADLPAYTMLCALLGANALVGCMKCDSMGLYVPVLHKTVYDEDVRRNLPQNHPFRTDPSFGKPEHRGPFQRRTHALIQQRAEIVVTLQGGARERFIQTTGVKGQSELLRAPYFDIVEKPQIDAFHVVANVGERTLELIQGKRDTKECRIDMNEQEFLGRSDWISSRPVQTSESDGDGDVEMEDVMPQLPWVLDQEEMAIFKERLRLLRVPTYFGARPETLILPGHRRKGADLENFIAILLPHLIRGLLHPVQRATLIALSQVVRRILCAEVVPETEPQLKIDVVEVIARIQRDLPRSERVMMVHLLQHLVDQRTDGSGPARVFRMYGPERWHSWVQGLAHSRKAPVANIAEVYDMRQLLFLAGPSLVKTGLIPAASLSSRYSERVKLGGEGRLEPLSQEVFHALDRVNRTVFPDYAVLHREFEVNRRSFQEERAKLRKHHKEADLPAVLASFPDSLEVWVTRSGRALSAKQKSLLEGPGLIGMSYEHLLVDGRHFRSERLDSRNKVTQDSGVKASLKTRLPGSAEEEQVTYYGRFQSACEMDVAGSKELYLNVRWFRKAVRDADGLLVLKNGAMVKANFHPWIHLSELEGQVFYAEDRRDRRNLIVLEKDPRKYAEDAPAAADGVAFDGVGNAAAADGDDADAVAREEGVSAGVRRGGAGAAQNSGERDTENFDGEVSETESGESDARGARLRAQDGPEGGVEVQERTHKDGVGPNSSQPGGGPGGQPDTGASSGEGTASRAGPTESDSDRTRAAHAPTAVHIHGLEAGCTNLFLPERLRQVAAAAERPDRLPFATGLRRCLEWGFEGDGDASAPVTRLRYCGNRASQKFDVLRSSFRRLKDGEWLNNEIMDAVAGLIADKADAVGGLPSVCFVSSMFVAQLAGRGYDPGFINRHAQRLQLNLGSENVFFTVNSRGNHWILLLVTGLSGAHPKIAVYDSMREPDPAHYRSSIEVVTTLYEKCFNIPKSAWGVSIAKCPQQDNQCDCGVFALHFLERLATGQEGFTLTAASASYQRLLIAIEILRGRLF